MNHKKTPFSLSAPSVSSSLLLAQTAGGCSSPAQSLQGAMAAREKGLM